jgi:hypothetical protein
VSRLAQAVPVFIVLAAALPASAQYGPGGYYPGGYSQGGYDSGHYDVIPGHYHRHGNHYDYHPPQVLYHQGNMYQPVYPSGPQTTYYPGSAYPSQGYLSQGYLSQGYPSQPYAAQPYAAQPYAAQPYQTVEAPTNPHALTPPVPGGIGHVDDVVVAFEQSANQMCLEMYYNYRQNPGWNETYREAYEILDTARQIHAMEHSGDREQMRYNVTRIDALFHHVQDDVRHWARFGTQYFGPGGLRARMDEVEDNLHHLMQDIGAPAPEDLQPAPATQGSSALAPSTVTPSVAPAAPSAGPVNSPVTPSTAAPFSVVPYAPSAQP